VFSKMAIGLASTRAFSLVALFVCGGGRRDRRPGRGEMGDVTPLINAAMCQLSLRRALTLLPFQELSEQRSLILWAQIAGSTAILSEEAVERTRILCRGSGVSKFSEPQVAALKRCHPGNLDVQTCLGPFRVTWWSTWISLL
jgi:hypothetical protein